MLNKFYEAYQARRANKKEMSPTSKKVYQGISMGFLAFIVVIVAQMYQAYAAHEDVEDFVISQWVNADRYEKRHRQQLADLYYEKCISGAMDKIMIKEECARRYVSEDLARIIELPNQILTRSAFPLSLIMGE